MTSPGSALPPATCSTKEIRSRWSTRLSASIVTCSLPGAGEQGAQLIQLGCGRMVARDPPCPAERAEEREQRAVVVMGRAEIAQAKMRFGPGAPPQCRSEARLAVPRLAGDQHNLAVARL